jgi:CRISPR/Cas system CMR-associated protein Cmr3 (group 5 of RAMP superfamily)
MKTKSLDEHDVFEIPSTEYSNSSVFNHLILKQNHHFEGFDRVMKGFDVEMVGIFLFASLFFGFEPNVNVFQIPDSTGTVSICSWKNNCRICLCKMSRMS